MCITTATGPCACTWYFAGPGPHFPKAPLGPSSVFLFTWTLSLDHWQRRLFFPFSYPEDPSHPVFPLDAHTHTRSHSSDCLLYVQSNLNLSPPIYCCFCGLCLGEGGFVFAATVPSLLFPCIATISKDWKSTRTNEAAKQVPAKDKMWSSHLKFEHAQQGHDSSSDFASSFHSQSSQPPQMPPSQSPSQNMPTTPRHIHRRGQSLSAITAPRTPNHQLRPPVYLQSPLGANPTGLMGVGEVFNAPSGSFDNDVGTYMMNTAPLVGRASAQMIRPKKSNKK